MHRLNLTGLAPDASRGGETARNVTLLKEQPRHRAILKPLKSNRIDLAALGREPYRLFFLLGTFAGMVGVALWPLHLTGLTANYPGIVHARIMAFGFFGAFIFGFLGTAMPRMLSVHPLGLPLVGTLASLHIAMLASFAGGYPFAGDALFVAMLVTFAVAIGSRFSKRKDTPPPGFVLVGLSFASVAAGSILGVVQHRAEMPVFWINLQRLLCYQAFILLPILGIGPFLLPRFFGMPSPHDFPEFTKPSRAWIKKALLAALTGLVILATFFLEAAGQVQAAYAVRFLATAGYLFLEMPFHRAPARQNPFGIAIRLAFALIAGGFLTIALWPAYRVGLLHLTFVGGFALLTFVVATRVVFGHSGNLPMLKGPNRWLWVVIGIMFFGMATRISGDFWPNIMATHYIYGAILWIAAVLLWAIRVLPLVRIADEE